MTARPLAPVLVSPPSETPISLAEAKAHLRVFHDDDDALIAAHLAAATAHLDGFGGILGRCLVTQSWRQDLGAFPCDRKLRLPLAPVASVTHVKYRDASDAEQTLSTSVYAGPLVDALGPFVALKSGQSWPSTYARDDAVSVTFVAGYGAASAAPEPIKAALKLHVERLYFADAARAPTLQAAEAALIAPYRRIGL